MSHSGHISTELRCPRCVRSSLLLRYHTNHPGKGKRLMDMDANQRVMRQHGTR